MCTGLYNRPDQSITKLADSCFNNQLNRLIVAALVIILFSKMWHLWVNVAARSKNLVFNSLKTDPGPWLHNHRHSAARKSSVSSSWDYIGIVWTCHHQPLRSLDERSELHSGSVTSVFPCVGGHLWKERVSLLTVFPGLQDQHWRPHLCLHSTTASVRLTKGILFLSWYWDTCRNTHWPNLFHHQRKRPVVSNSSCQSNKRSN